MPPSSPPMRRVLQVSAPHFVAGAVWERDRNQIWRCVRSAPILRWMEKATPHSAEATLTRYAYRWEWL